MWKTNGTTHTTPAQRAPCSHTTASATRWLVAVRLGEVDKSGTKKGVLIIECHLQLYTQGANKHETTLLPEWPADMRQAPCSAAPPSGASSSSAPTAAMMSSMTAAATPAPSAASPPGAPVPGTS